MRILIGKELDPLTWDGEVWEDHTEDENSDPSDSQGFISPRETVPSALLLEILPFLIFTEEIHPSFSAKPVVTFSEGYSRQDHTGVSQSPP